MVALATLVVIGLLVFLQRYRGADRTAMALSVLGMLWAAAGYLPPVAGAIAQEVIDLAVVLNALRVAMPPRDLTDF